MAQPYVIVPQQGQDQADEWIRLGVEAQVQGKLPDAQRYYNNALRVDPRNAVATQNLAVVFAQSNLMAEALLTIERACMFDERHAVMRMNWALMALETDRIDDALRAGREAVAIKGTVESRFALAVILAGAGLPEQAIPLYNEILAEQPLHAAAGPNACFVQTLTNATPADLLAQRRKWYDAVRWKGTPAPHGNDLSVDRPLRVGYVSGDFKRHSAAMIFGRVALHHSPAVEPYFYSTLPIDAVNDTMSKRFLDAAGPRWRDVQALDDEKTDALIRQDRIDVLVDLSAHTGGGRLQLFTRKPAPVQVTAWGFAHGTGLPDMDYFFADGTSVPAEERSWYSEEIWDLPSIITYEPPLEYDLKESSPLPYYTRGHLTLMSSARFEKLSDECLRTFGEILKAVPRSKLLLKDNAFRRPYSIRRVMAAMPGVDPDRVLFAPPTSHPEHMQSYQGADLCLDPFPHSGGIVSLEQLYMGVPVVTLYGTQAGGRNTSSVLTAMGRSEWIAKTPGEYVGVVAAVTADLQALAAVRKTLRRELLDSPVCKGYVEKVEEAYREMWRVYVQGER
jgi:predicted O-linked N-acetylglucosamine transferase (SPINDLY family)